MRVEDGVEYGADIDFSDEAARSAALQSATSVEGALAAVLGGSVRVLVRSAAHVDLRQAGALLAVLDGSTVFRYQARRAGKDNVIVVDIPTPTDDRQPGYALAAKVVLEGGVVFSHAGPSHWLPDCGLLSIGELATRAGDLRVPDCDDINPYVEQSWWGCCLAAFMRVNPGSIMEGQRA